MNDSSDDDDLWEAMADPTRRKLLDLLVRIGRAWRRNEQQVERLVDMLGHRLPRRDAGLIERCLDPATRADLLTVARQGGTRQGPANGRRLV